MHVFKKLTLSLIVLFGLVFSLAPATLATSADIQKGLCAGSNLQLSDNNSGSSCSTKDASQKINDIVHTVINLFSAVVGIVAVVMIIVGGLRYITSGGNDASVTSAKNTLLYAIIGLVIVALAQIIVRFTLNKITQ